MRSGKIFLQDQEVQLPELVTKLQAIAQNNQDRRIFVRGDKDLAYGRIMEVMGTITQGGFTKVALLAEQPTHRYRPAVPPAPAGCPPRYAVRRPDEEQRVLQRVLRGADRRDRRTERHQPDACGVARSFPAAIHLVILAAAAVGLPFAKPPEEPQETAVAMVFDGTADVLDEGAGAGRGAGAGHTRPTQRPAPQAQQPPKPQPIEAAAASAAAATTHRRRHPGDGAAAARRRPRPLPPPTPSPAAEISAAAARRAARAAAGAAAAADAAAAGAAATGAAAARSAKRDLAAEPDEEPGAGERCAGEHAGEAAQPAAADPAAEGALQSAGRRRAERRRQPDER